MREKEFQSAGDDPRVAKLQIERYRAMSDEERLTIGLRMWTFARDFITSAIRNEQPNLSDVELQKLVAHRMKP